MGQQNYFKYDKESLFNKHNKILMKQVDLWYIEDKFAIDSDFSEKEAMNSYLLKDMYKTENCEVVKFLNKKLRGALGDENIKVIDLPELTTQYPDINNYFYNANYEEVEF